MILELPPRFQDGEQAEARAALPERHCRFCWTPLEPGSSECSDCGLSVAEMDRCDAEEVATTDRWVPPARDERKQRRAPRPVAPARGQRGQRGPAVRKIAVGAAVVVGGAALLAAGAGLESFRGRRAAPAPPPAPVPAQAVVPSLTQARVRWISDVPALRLELRTRTGEVVASLGEESAVQDGEVAPGVYTLRISDRDGSWGFRDSVVNASEGETLWLSPPAKVVAEYYTWLGKRHHARKRVDEAAAAWRQAIAADPDFVEPRLQLAALMAVHFRYDEARAQVSEALKRAPRDSRLLRLRKNLDRLEVRW